MAAREEEELMKVYVKVRILEVGLHMWGYRQKRAIAKGRLILGFLDSPRAIASPCYSKPML
jgi:hypothetical protein